MTLSATQLLKIVQDHHLVEADRLQALLQKLPAGILDQADSSKLADELAQAKLLTKFQLALLTSGKSRSLLVAGKYRIVDRLGSGGMGLVYLCEHIKMKRLVALKVLPQKAAQEPGTLERFLREAQAAASLRHPNIVQAFDTDTDGGVHYFVMEYVEGVDFDRLVSKIGPLNPNRAAYYIAQAAEGLQQAAERGLVHRDIKPANLLVDREGVVKILDLGLARVFEAKEGLTERFDQNSVIGTADYIAPEQAIDSHQVDTRADIYSLGVTFYFLLAGQPPFKDGNVAQKLLSHQIKEPTPITKFRQDVPEAMLVVLQKMMAKKPEDRFSTPAEVADALSPWTEEPPPPPTETEIPASVLPSGSGSSRFANSSRSIAMTTRTRKTSGTSPSGSLSKLTQHPNRVGLSQKLIWVGGGSLLAVIVLLIWRPWAGSTTPMPKTEPGENGVAVTPTPKEILQPQQARPDPVPLPTGFNQVTMEPHVPRPSVSNGALRAASTDVLWFTGSEQQGVPTVDRDLLANLRAGLPSAGNPKIIPFVLGSTSGAKIPNSLVAIDPAKGILPIEMSTSSNSELARDKNLVWTTGVALSENIVDANSLTAPFADISAASGGTTLKLYSGVMLLRGSATGPNAVFGSGPNKLTIDFNNQTGFVHITGEPTASPATKEREVVIRARIIGLGTQPLTLSGTSGIAVKLDHLSNEVPRLVVQGLDLGTSSQDRMFRLNFSDDLQLGKADSPIALADAVLAYTGDARMDVRRPVQIRPNRVGRFHFDLGTKQNIPQYWWHGKISGGGRLEKSGKELMFIANAGNDYTGGTDILAGNLSIQSRYGTPLGSGSVTVQPGALLSGTGKILGGVIIKPTAMLSPGNDDGSPMRISGTVVFESNKNASKSTPSIFRARLTPKSSTLAIYDGADPVDFSQANLRVQTTPEFQPKPESKIYLWINEKAAGVTAPFQHLSQGSRVVSIDQRWAAAISYTADAKTGSPQGGKDLMLYDWKPTGK